MSQEVRRLLAENAWLKKLLAEEELVLDIKEELLKKIHQRLLSAPWSFMRTGAKCQPPAWYLLSLWPVAVIIIVPNWTSGGGLVAQLEAMVDNQAVVEWIRELLQHPFIYYGYEKVTDWLQQNKYLINNKKKVYRLMKQARLLLPKKPANQSARCFVEVRRMVAERPNEAFQFDIKMYWVTGVGWVPCLSVIDIFTRQLKAYLLQRSIRQQM